MSLIINVALFILFCWLFYRLVWIVATITEVFNLWYNSYVAVYNISLHKFPFIFLYIFIITEVLNLWYNSYVAVFNISLHKFPFIFLYIFMHTINFSLDAFTSQIFIYTLKLDKLLIMFNQFFHLLIFIYIINLI